MARSKVLAQRQANCKTPWGTLPVRGYEIHHGRTRLGKGVQVRIAGAKKEPWLVSNRAGRVWGSYLHGLLDNDGLRQAFLTRLAKAQGKPVPQGLASAVARREQALNRFAAHMEEHLDLSFLPAQAPA
jgi:adenosylcobyric acid synthase